MDSFKKWKMRYRKSVSAGKEKMWPSETLIRIMKGDYISKFAKDYENKKVLDIGCGIGTNLSFLSTLGLKIYGCEVDKDIIKLVKENLSSLECKAIVKLGSNRSIPFKQEFFDYLVSWNVVHYENTEKKIKEAIKEYARVLKKGGRIFLSTTGPMHMILDGAKSVGKHLYKIGDAGGFRKGEIYFYFDKPEYLKLYFQPYFENIQVGKVKDYLFEAYQDYFIMTATKK